MLKLENIKERENQIMSKKIDVFINEEWKKFNSDDVFFNGINENHMEDIEECYVQGDTLEIIYRSCKPTTYYKKVHGVWSFSYSFK